MYSLAVRLTIINMMLIRQLQRRNDSSDLCTRPTIVPTTYAPNGPCNAPW